MREDGQELVTRPSKGHLRYGRVSLRVGVTVTVGAAATTCAAATNGAATTCSAATNGAAATTAAADTLGAADREEEIVGEKNEAMVGGG